MLRVNEFTAAKGSLRPWMTDTGVHAVARNDPDTTTPLKTWKCIPHTVFANL